MYYWVAYGHVVRCEKAGSADEAMKLAYGMVDSRQMTLQSSATKPSRLSSKKQSRVVTDLAVRHFHRTGSIISGQEKEPGIADTHWTECQLCKKPITTQPKSAGVDEACCAACEDKLSAVTGPDREQLAQLPVSQIRAQLNISQHESECCVAERSNQ